MFTCIISFIVGFEYSLFFLFIVGLFLFYCLIGYGSIGLGLFSELVVIDSLSLVMSTLTVLLYIVLSVIGASNVFLTVSVMSALICYMAVNALVFWFFYELSIICALFLLVKDSLYPERYLASWYLGCYILLGSVPLLLCILYLGISVGSFNFCMWLSDKLVARSVVLVVVAIIFSSKIPLFPFHGWLPLVHAEASSPVSIILSGYIMKLGLVGILRICWGSLSVWNVGFILTLIFFFSLLYIISSHYESDSKRWLALLSLSHIVISVILLFLGDYSFELVGLFYCLGHGLAAGGMFMLIWWVNTLINSRSWSLVVKFYGFSVILQLLSALVFMMVSGFPPSLQIFGEILAVDACIISGELVLLILVSLYLFGASLVVLTVLGSVLCSLSSSSNVNFSYTVVVVVGVVYYIFVGLLLFIFV
uniref:NADH-ubiquinone oxidoreductase chain 4 n=1 Tax=Schistosoma turkestanicum TaxID=1163369 RepID=G4WCQ3_9TREM|nr:NADH dehydrogenase subunit 4 [Schistosoma turkestanicum]